MATSRARCARVKYLGRTTSEAMEYSVQSRYRAQTPSNSGPATTCSLRHTQQLARYWREGNCAFLHSALTVVHLLLDAYGCCWSCPCPYDRFLRLSLSLHPRSWRLCSLCANPATGRAKERKPWLSTKVPGLAAPGVVTGTCLGRPAACRNSGTVSTRRSWGGLGPSTESLDPARFAGAPSACSSLPWFVPGESGSKVKTPTDGCFTLGYR